MNRFRYLESRDMKVISDILSVYEENMKKNKLYMPTTILSSINRFKLEMEDMSKDVVICEKCGGLTK